MQFNKELFAANLRAARARLHISQRELARMAGVSTYSIAQYETGEGSEPLAGSVFAICVALGVSPNELIGWKEVA